MSRRLQRTARVVTVMVVLALALLIYVDDQHSYDVTTEQFMFESGGNQLAATLVLPADKKPIGVVVFIHGDGPIDADNDDIGYWPIWEALADAGWASVSWDKPGVGDSSGNWLDQTMQDRATEAVEAIAWLSNNQRVNTDRVGLIGFSQAGWVLPLIANAAPVDFVIAGSPAVSWLDQGRYLTTTQLDNNDASDELREAVITADNEGRDLLDADASYDTYLVWARQLSPAVSPYFGEMSAERWDFVGNNYRSDATNSLASMPRTPVLLLLAGHDDNVDVDDTDTAYRRLISESCLTVATYPNADHSLLDQNGTSLVFTGIFAPRDIYADGLLETIASFATTQAGC